MYSLLMHISWTKANKTDRKEEEEEDNLGQLVQLFLNVDYLQKTVLLPCDISATVTARTFSVNFS
jgi:hypothetical protein